MLSPLCCGVYQYRITWRLALLFKSPLPIMAKIANSTPSFTLCTTISVSSLNWTWSGDGEFWVNQPQCCRRLCLGSKQNQSMVKLCAAPNCLSLPGGDLWALSITDLRTRIRADPPNGSPLCLFVITDHAFHQQWAQHYAIPFLSAVDVCGLL